MSRQGWVLFAALSIIWGIPYLLIRVAVQEMAPATLVVLRTAPAALLLLPLALRHGRLRAVLAHWPWVLAFTVTEITVPWLLLSHAEQRLSSSMAGLLVATVPLIGALLARFSRPPELFSVRRVLGLLVGFAGVAALVGLDLGTLDPRALLEIAIVAVCYASAPFIVSRRLVEVPSVAVVTVGLAFTALVYSPLAILAPPRDLSAKAATAIAFLAVVCTALAFVLFFRLIREAGPARSTVVAYINPAVAVALGVTLLGEPLTVGMAVGFPLVLLGSVAATARPRAATLPSPAAAASTGQIDGAAQASGAVRVPPPDEDDRTPGRA